ncbi:MAG: FAD-dependent oxidoreductase [Oscillospiraceae bacterium]|nr:FAD-dependent oxidoreductase [Oscillospiraceae bacterium]
MFEQKYPHLLQPLRLRGLTVRNRIMSAPNMLFQTIGGRTTEYYTRYLEAKARGGAGIVTLGEVPVCDGGCHTPGTVMSRENLAIFSEMSAAIREHGAVSSVELTHGGRNARHEFNVKNPMGPDETDSMYGHVNAMTKQDMEDVAEAFADAAEYWYGAGFDTVLIHAAHGWLFPQFLSPLANHRTDEYGGSLENRMRFPLMTLKRIRDRVGPEKVVMIRLSGADREPGGMTVEEVTEFLSRAQEYVDLAEISSEGITWFFGTTFRPWCLNSDLSAAIKQSGKVRIPVFSIGSVLSPEMAEGLIASGKCDGVSMSRALIADPCLPEKAMEGRGEDVRPCLRCLNCTDGDNLHRHFSCTVNPLTGHEQRLGFGDEPVAPAAHKKKVLVVGGGPAGMTAAVTAARRGHRVILCEKSGRLGGTVNFCDEDSLKVDLRRWRDWLLRQTAKAAVEVLLNTEVTPELVRALAPDHIIAAAGAEPVTPNIPGVGLARHALAAYGEPGSVGDRVVVIGGGLVGVECGMHLCNTGHAVTVLEAMDEAVRDAGPVYKIGLTAKAEELGLDLRTGAKVLEITADGVRYEKDGREETLPADTVLYAVGMRSRTETYLALAPLAPHVDLVGDCKAPGKLLGAVHGGYFAAMDIGRF